MKSNQTLRSVKLTIFFYHSQMSDKQEPKQEPSEPKLIPEAPNKKVAMLFKESMLNILAEIAAGINDVNETLQDICIRLEE